MTCKFLTVFGICVALVGITCIVVVVVTNSNFEGNLENALREQINTHTQKTIDGSVRSFSELMKTAQNNVRIYTKASSDTYRTPYSMGFTQSYFEYGDTGLKTPLTQDSRQAKPVSFGASAYYLPGFTPTDYGNITGTNLATRDKSVNLDPYWIQLYNQYEDFVSLYVGYEEGGMFRAYPGTGTLDTDPTRTYDPRVRGWYTSAKATPGATIVTEPYQDFNGRGWMITHAQVIRSDADNSIVGVAGSDVLISKIKQNIEGIQFLQTGKVTLFDTSSSADPGIVVADREWAADPNVNTLFTYKDLQNPPVSDSLWTWIAETDSIKSGTHEINGERWVITAQNVQSFGQYIMCVFVRESEILAPMNSITSEMNDVNGKVSGAVVGMVVGSTVICVLIIVLTAYCISKPLDQANSGLDTIFKNVGRQGYANDVNLDAGGVGKEERRMVREFRGMIDHLQENQEDPLIEDNPQRLVGPVFTPIRQGQAPPPAFNPNMGIEVEPIRAPMMPGMVSTKLDGNANADYSYYSDEISDISS